MLTINLLTFDFSIKPFGNYLKQLWYVSIRYNALLFYFICIQTFVPFYYA